MGGGRSIRGFKPPIGQASVLRSCSKGCQKDRMNEGFQRVESAQIVGVTVAGEDDWRMSVTRGSPRTTTHPKRVQTRGLT